MNGKPSHDKCPKRYALPISKSRPKNKRFKPEARFSALIEMMTFMFLTIKALKIKLLFIFVYSVTTLYNTNYSSKICVHPDFNPHMNLTHRNVITCLIV